MNIIVYSFLFVNNYFIKAQPAEPTVWCVKEDPCCSIEALHRLFDGADLEARAVFTQAILRSSARVGSRGNQNVFSNLHRVPILINSFLPVKHQLREFARWFGSTGNASNLWSSSTFAGTWTRRAWVQPYQ